MKTERPYSHLTDDVLLTETFGASSREKVALLELLDYLAEVDKRKAFAIEAYSSLFDYVVRGLGYSEAQAAERVNAVRLMRTVVPVKAHLRSGALNLTSAAKLHRHFQAEKKLAEDLSQEEKLELIERCLHQPKREIERILLEVASEPVSHAMSERMRQVTPDRVEIKFCIDEPTRKKLDRIRELTGERTLESVFEAALDAYLQQEEKKRKREAADSLKTAEFTRSTRPATQPKKSEKDAADSVRVPETPTSTRYIPAETKRKVFRRAGDQCEFRSASGKRCPSRYLLQVDHRIPIAFGGLTELKNLRALCPEHNQRAAMEAGLRRP
jgi:5-methylcytosine-specific restriction endonuclease McrA